MLSIPVVLGSTRRGRQSVHVARHVTERLQRRDAVQVELVDLLELDLPILEERLSHRDDPPPGLPELARTFDAADAFVLVSPEYNHGYPGVLKNALDYLHREYRRKPFGLVGVSAGGYGGLRAVELLRPVVAGLGGFAIPGFVGVSKVREAYDADGRARDAALDDRLDRFVDELLWYAEAIQARRRADESDG